ncbi:MAG: copper-binding protein, partial [Actinobacteria bacterium]|nr:copper-binding protein [Actinomycetota bacterium]
SHTVTGGTPETPDPNAFDSRVLTPGSNFAVTFDEPGVYSLYCTLHPGMTAEVEVD